jgi:PKD repeat protein
MNLLKANTVLTAFIFSISVSLTAQNNPSDVLSEFTITNYLEAPVRIAINDNDDILIVDQHNKTINIYDAQGLLKTTIPVQGSPISIAIDENNAIYYGDSESGKIFKLDKNNNTSIFYAESALPSAMVFGTDQKLYVSDSHLNEVTVLDATGSLAGRIGQGVLSFPTGLAFDFKNERIVVAEHGAVDDATAVSVYIFDLEGNLITQFGSEAPSSWFGGVQVPGDGEFNRVQGVAVSRCGTIYVIDPFQATISVFDEAVSFKTKFGEFGSADGQLDIPLDIALDSNDRLVISCFNKGSIEVYSFTDILPTSNIKVDELFVCSGATADIPIHFTGVGPWNFTYSIDGQDQPALTTNASPYILSTSIEGLYAISALSDVNAAGTCFTGEVQVNVNSVLPAIDLSSVDPIICAGEEAELVFNLSGTPPFTFTYTIDGSNPTNITTSDNQYVLITDIPGLYEGTSLEGAGCSEATITGSVAVEIKDIPSAQVLNEEKYYRSTTGTSIAITIGFTGTPPFTFSYSNNETDEVAITTMDNPYVLNVGQEGTYEILGIEDAHCFNATWQDFFDIYYDDPELPTATFTQPSLSICNGDNVDIPIYFTGTGPWQFTYVRDGQYPTEVVAQTSPYYLNTDTSGEYKIVALSDTEAEGVEFNGSTYIDVLTPAVSNYFYEVRELDVQFINGSFEADSYYWTFGNGHTSTEENPSMTYTEEGTYLVSLTAFNGLCDPITMTKEVKVGEEILSGEIDDNYKKYTLIVYPNPSYGEFTLKISPKRPIYSNINIMIMSLSGQLVYEHSYDPKSVTYYGGSYYLNISLTNFVKGIHVLNINANNYKEQEKLILKD